MSDEEQQPQTQEEVKSEDPNATINIKVRFRAVGRSRRNVLLIWAAVRLPGREFDGRRGVLQNQTQHEAEQAAGGVCEQSGQGRRQHSVRAAFSAPLRCSAPLRECGAGPSLACGIVNSSLRPRRPLFCAGFCTMGPG